MKVNRTNYEVFMIDYFDSRLNAEEIADLMAFIEENPDAKSELESFENVSVGPEDIDYSLKNELRKGPVIASSHINEESYEDYFIAYHEGDLEENKRMEVVEFVDTNPDLENEFTFHKELFLKADSSSIFSNKGSLKHKPLVGIYWQITTAAATILILFALFALLQTNKPNINDRVYSMNKLSTRTLSLKLQQNSVPDIIEITTTFLNFSEQAEGGFEEELLAINQLSPQSPDIAVINYNDYTRLAEKELALYDIANALAQTDEPKHKKAFGRIIQNFARRVSGNLPKQNADEINNDPKFVKALGTGIIVFNTITGSDTELVKSYNQSGNLTRYTVDGETIAWRRDIVPNTE